MSQSDDTWVSHPEVLTLHWEGPAAVELPPDHHFPESAAERREQLAEERERQLRGLSQTEHGRALWEQIRSAAAAKGDGGLWRRKLHAYWWVKLGSKGTAGDYARRYEVNHATVRSWIHDVSKLAYEVGYRLHEDKLLLVGEAPAGLRRLRELVNRDAGSAEAWEALRVASPRYRGVDPYFHLNEGHALRARGALRESDATLKEGLTIAEARRVRSLLWNARGQTFWDCRPGETWTPPGAAGPLEHAEKAFRRAAILDPSTYFPFVNLAQLAVDVGDLRRAEYWIVELASARKGMDAAMQQGLAEYLEDADWARPFAGRRSWKNGPAKWIRAARKTAAVAALLLGFGLGLAAPPTASADSQPVGIEVPENGGRSARGGAGGN